MNYELFYSQYFPFWNQLTQEDKDYLCAHSTTVHFEKEQAVYTELVKKFIVM